MTLKVGDKVRVTHGHYNHPELVGREFVIADLGLSGETARYPDPPGRHRHIHLNNLEKIEEPTPTFKVGDRARDSFSKDVVTVMATDAHSAWPIRARYADGAYGLWKESELTKVESVPFKLERGDKVVNRKTGREGFVLGGLVYDYPCTPDHPVPTKALEEYEEHHPGTYDLIKKDAPW